MKPIVVIYHDQCKDGFGAAYAAWKKFGNSATYIPLKTQATLPESIEDTELYIVDYSFDLPTLTTLRKHNRQVVVIDHHISAKAVVTAFPENVFDINHSGAVLAWQYFHPGAPIPKLLLYVEDHDIWKFSLPNNEAIGAALSMEPMTFEHWDELATELETEAGYAAFVATGAIASRVGNALTEELLTYRERVRFEGHELYAVNIARPHRSIIGHRLAQLNADSGGIALGIVYYRNGGTVHVSLRSEGDVDVSVIATKYGGGGHTHAASFRVASFNELPFTFL